MKTMSIRRKLLNSFSITAGIACVSVLFAVFIVARIVNSVSKSYETNSYLDSYSNVLSLTENALETYMNVRSFEGIDAYYNNRSRLDELTSAFYSKPSSDSVLLLEYKITRMAESFLVCADMAVSARRANNIQTASNEYAKALQAYDFLSESIAELNTLYFKRNITRYDSTMETVIKAGLNCVLLIFTVIILNIILIWLLVTNITRPLVDISKVANRLAERDFDIPLFKIQTQDEVGNICRAFNRMIVSIREYIDTIWKKAVEENRLREREMQMTSLYKDAQLKALQSQINPHFLFNTLNTGVQLAMMEDADKTSYFIEQVADFFRYNIRCSGKETTLAEEISLIDNYIYIMKVRFGNKFEFIKEIHTENLQLLMPGMSLQPIVEDCIKHGLKDASRDGRIKLKVYDSENDCNESIGSQENAEYLNYQDIQTVENDMGLSLRTYKSAEFEKKDEKTKLQLKYNGKCVCIDISDNGTGFPKEAAEQVLKKASSVDGAFSELAEVPTVETETKTQSTGTGIGLINVVSRLQLFFHSNSIISIKDNTCTDLGSGLGHGTIFSIRIPLDSTN